MGNLGGVFMGSSDPVQSGDSPKLFSRLFAVLFAVLTIGAAAYVMLAGAQPATATDVAQNVHLGVASCAGSTCHGRQVADGAVVRQDELLRWQEDSSTSGAHSRAFRTLGTARSAAIARNLGLASAETAPMCLGCHSDNASATGPKHQLSDGVGCESCHGGSSGWISSHYAVGASHERNVAQGLTPLSDPKSRASNCLDCHFGSSKPGQFVSHRIMAAGHPRVTFELDLFTGLQAHHNEDADYVRRKGKRDPVQDWAVGQAMALDRALSLWSDAGLGQEGIFPEYYFFDCHSCHRRISDDPSFRSAAVANPGRPIPRGMAPFSDGNMIMLSAAARRTSPALAQRFDADSKAFHAALASDRPKALKAAARLRSTTNALLAAFGGKRFSSGDIKALVASISDAAMRPRYTDYDGSTQAVMAVDTLLNALVNNGSVSAGQAASIRAEINRAYAAVKDPYGYQPAAFRSALSRASNAIGGL